jgi:hypothetical protein
VYHVVLRDDAKTAVGNESKLWREAKESERLYNYHREGHLQFFCCKELCWAKH